MAASRPASINALDLYRDVSSKVEALGLAEPDARPTACAALGRGEPAADMPLVSHDGYTETALPKVTPLADAEQRTWEECRKLRDSVPSPAAYTPHLWRKYLDGLLRAEEIIRAGDSGRLV